ncbi:TMEM175 family protein [Lactococcus nasutitermitis]|uniref:TMEM175 family protein n=1 Tax=Lactococcus nasutitermitis TaxID=1652957 RepID=A0ABV9JCC6_9LACT|nr:TMEM175 family protein [Lactococcus nasutitermitis]
MTKTRLEAFTDAVIAIIMTILVLELSGPKSDTLESLIELLPHLGVYFISFIILAIYWVNHHHLFQSIKKISGDVLWINILFLFILSLVPVFSNWVSHYPNSFIPELGYVLVFFFANFMYFILTKQLLKVNGHLHSSDSTLKKNILSVVMNIISIALGYFIAPVIMLFGSALVFSMWIIPDKKVEAMFK